MQAAQTLDNVAEDDVLAVEPVACEWHRVGKRAITHHAVLTVQRKNWEPLVPGPALAMERTPAPVCLLWGIVCQTLKNQAISASDSQSEVLVGELGAVDGLAAGSVSSSEVTTLESGVRALYLTYWPLSTDGARVPGT